MLIELLNNGGYGPECGDGFKNVTFPVTVKAEPYRYGENNEFTIESLAHVKSSELARIGYNGPMIEVLSFSQSDRSWRHSGPFGYWNHLKQSRDVGA